MGINLKDFLTKTNGGHFYVMDTETTGFKPENSDVIEISAVKVKNNAGKFEVVGEFDSYINPHYPLPEAIVRFNLENGTGITDELLAKAPDVKAVAKELYEFLGKEPYVVGHNLDFFDTPFINKVLYTGAREYFTPKDTFDTLSFIQSIEGRKRGVHKLGNIHAERTDGRFAREGGVFHTSIADCLATLDVLNYEKDTFCKDLQLEATLESEPKKRLRIQIFGR